MLWKGPTIMSKKKKKEKEEEPKKVKVGKVSQTKPAPVEKAASPTPKPKKAPAAKKKPTVVISIEEISLRAYFISEHRQKLGLPGTEHGDWVEAERQLREEAAK